MNVINALIFPITRDAIEKKKEFEEGDTLRYHLINYTDGKREKRLEYNSAYPCSRTTALYLSNRRFR